ncbi:hypothetical protein BP5796_07805 [Coleophoma crateriformis]|uniref:Uncharacterized protein n=1 Tax=Coleophoma crateriformis TaxID=565419 RepID=A0A3D8RD04_9HELO|nr:hypothetical protein BP5796_07805 [Coleophoma crateriformis]
MAPATNAAKNLQGNRARPTATKAVTPALPIQYTQKRKQTVARKAEADPEPTPAAQIDPTPISSAPEVSTIIGDGSADALVSVKGEIEQPKDGGSEEDVPSSDAAKIKEAIKDLEAAAQREPAQEIAEESQPTNAEAQSNMSKPTYQMPPTFYPGNYSHPHQQDHARVPVQPPFNGQHPIHHTHPSAGSLVFGGYAESNNSSPAPPPSTGNMPPPYGFPQQALPVGRSQAAHPNGQQQTMSNGFSQMGPPPPGYYRQDSIMTQNPTTDSYARRQMVSFAPPDGYSPSGTPVISDNQRFAPFDASTPHSFHGSQSSAPNEHIANGHSFYSQYSPDGVPNGSNGHVEDVRLYQQPRPKTRPVSQSIAPSQGQFPVMSQPQFPPPGMDNLDGLISYIQAQFADPTMADYTLELRYSDDRAEPVRIPGHNLMFARSPTLKNIMTAQAHDSTTDGLSVRTLLIETDDRYLRSDAFWMAVQRLYGGPLLDIGALGAMNSASAAQSTSNMPGSPTDRFDLALGYAAAGHILQVPPVINRGVEIASHFVNWLTIEKALEFALDGGLDSQWTLEGGQAPGTRSPSTYGPAVNLLIHHAMTYIITSFPPNFEFDSSVSDPVHIRRLPFVPAERAGVQNPRLSNIKFGDHLSEDPTRSKSSNSTNVILSKILLNLPHQLLKYVLESQRLGNVNAWATIALREKVMHAAIEEREKRRMKAYSSPHVSSSERKANGKQWEVVGWQECLLPPYGGSEIPVITRQWVDFMDPALPS